MPNIAAVLKTEIARVARKELRQEVEALKKTVSAQRSQLVELKRQVAELQRGVQRLQQGSTRGTRPAPADDEASSTGKPLRFSPARLKTQRKRLGLSADVFGKLVGASGQSVYLWESGKTRPGAQSLAAIAALRGIGKRELQTRLAGLGA